MKILIFFLIITGNCLAKSNDLGLGYKDFSSFSKFQKSKSDPLYIIRLNSILEFSLTKDQIEEKLFVIKDKFKEFEKQGIKFIYKSEKKEFAFWSSKYEILLALQLINDHELTRLFVSTGNLFVKNIFEGYVGLLSAERVTTREDLLSESRKFFQFYQNNKRESQSLCSQSSRPLECILNILIMNQGVIIGENHSDSGPKKFLIQNMKKFKEAGVTTLFLEHFFYDSSMQLSFDDLYFTETKELPLLLKEYLRYLDSGFLLIKNEYNFTNVVKTALHNGIRIVGIDTVTSYECGTNVNKGVTKVKDRMLCMNYIGQKIINTRRDQGKFLVLTGELHGTKTCEVPGLPELTNTPSLWIQSDEKSSETHVERNYSRTIQNYNIRYDYYFKNPCIAF